jgi:hypothetical protein
LDPAIEFARRPKRALDDGIRDYMQENGWE